MSDQTLQSPKPGIYRHYKGKDYQVYETAIHSETHEAFVVYRPLYGEKKLWVRPLSLFVGNVEINGESKPRFQWLASAQASTSKLD